MEILETMDYNIFNFIDENRDVKEQRVKKIKESIDSVGYIPNPIIVNEKMEIIDGQGRYTVLSRMGRPILYIIVPGIGIKECRSMNIGQTNWNTMDYVQSYASGGNKSYQMLLKLCKEFDNFKLQEIYGIVKNKILTSGAVSTLKDGKFEMCSNEYFDAVDSLSFLSDLLPELDNILGNNRLKRTLLNWCLHVDGCDKNRLKKIIKEQYPIFIPCADAIASLTQISSLYNKRIQNRIYFETVYKESLYEED